MLRNSKYRVSAQEYQKLEEDEHEKFKFQNSVIISSVSLFISVVGVALSAYAAARAANIKPGDRVTNQVVQIVGNASTPLYGEDVDTRTTKLFSPLPRVQDEHARWTSFIDTSVEAYVARARSQAYIDSETIPTYLINTYLVDKKDPFHKLSDVYDNGLAMSYFSALGDFQKATPIAETFIAAMTWHGYRPAKTTRGERLGLMRGSAKVDANQCVGDSTGSRCDYAYRGLRVRFMPDATITYGTAGDLRSVTLPVDTGNNAFAAMGMCKLAAKMRELQLPTANRYARVCMDMAFTVWGYRCEQKKNGGFDGFMGRGMKEGEPMTYLSVEHNIDTYALGNIIVENGLSDEAIDSVSDSWPKKMKTLSQRFYEDMYDVGNNKVYIGSSACGAADAINTGEAPPVDAVTWGTLAGVTQVVAGPEGAKRLYTGSGGIVGSMLTADTFALDDGCFDDIYTGTLTFPSVKGTRVPCSKLKPQLVFRGFKFSLNGYGVQWENAGSGAMALSKLRIATNKPPKGEFPDGNEWMQTLIDIKNLWRVMPAGIPAHFQQQYTEKVSGLDTERNTGLTWSYFRYQHAASTFWTAAAIKYEGDVATQSDNDEGFNFYSPTITLNNKISDPLPSPPTLDQIQNTIFPCTDEIIYRVVGTPGNYQVVLNQDLFGFTDPSVFIDTTDPFVGYSIDPTGKVRAGDAHFNKKFKGYFLCGDEYGWGGEAEFIVGRIGTQWTWDKTNSAMKIDASRQIGLSRCENIPIVKMLSTMNEKHRATNEYNTPLKVLHRMCDETYMHDEVGPKMLAPGDALRGRLQRCTSNEAKMFVVRAVDHLCAHGLP